MIEEIWKPVVGYEGLYEVSNKGTVKSLDRFTKSGRGNGNRFISGKILKSALNKKGYPSVVLCKDGKMFTQRVHRLVAEAFIPNPDNLPVVNHKDEDKTNNCVDNLEWCTNKYNCNYGTSISRMCETRLSKGINKYPELIGLAHKNHKEYMIRYKEIKKKEKAA